MIYIHRNIEKTILKAIETFRVIGITGPRQSGKSTLIKYLLKEKYKYISFDNFDTINEFHNDPVSFVKKYDKYIIFDEVQNAPELFNRLKIIVDNEPIIKGRFVLTGSSQFTLNRNITESLAGRIVLINLFPFDFNEIPENFKEESILKGSYPELINNSYKLSDLWYESYIKTYIERDVKNLQNIGDLRDFQRFMILVSSYSGKQIVLTEISNQIGISITTVKRWLLILEASYIIFFLSPYYKNFNKRITKTPKLYFFDTGLALYLMGLYNKINLSSNALGGQFFENYIVSEIKKLFYHQSLNSKIYFYRTSGGKEVDLIIEDGNDLIIAEIKSGSTPNNFIIKEIENLEIPSMKKYIIYRGESNNYKANIQFINYKEFLGNIIFQKD